MQRTVRLMALLVAAAAAVSGCAASSGTGKIVPAFATPNRPAVASGIPRLHAPQIVTITLVKGRVSGPSRVQVNRDSKVRLTVVADVVDHVFVNGYAVDLLTRVHAPVQEEFVASRAGSFQVRLRKSGLLLTTLVVS